MTDETQAVGAAFEPEDASPAFVAEEIDDAPEAESDPLDWTPDTDEQRVPLDRFKTVSQRAREFREQAQTLQEQLEAIRPLEDWTEVVHGLQQRGLDPAQVVAYLQQAAAAPQGQPQFAQEPTADKFAQWCQENIGYAPDELPDYHLKLAEKQFAMEEKFGHWESLQQQAEQQAAAAAFEAATAEVKAAYPVFQNDALFRPLAMFAAARWDAGDERSLKEIAAAMMQGFEPIIQQRVADYAQATGPRNAVPPVVAGGASVAPSAPNPGYSYNDPRSRQTSIVEDFLKSRRGSEV